MDAIKFLKEKNRMTKKCSIDCSDCPLSSEKNPTGFACGDLQRKYPEIAVDIVEKWSEEHPQETRLTEFLEHYPNALMEDDGTPEGCVNELGLKRDDGCISNCIKCWNTPIEEE